VKIGFIDHLKAVKTTECHVDFFLIVVPIRRPLPSVARLSFVSSFLLSTELLPFFSSSSGDFFGGNRTIYVEASPVYVIIFE